MSTYRRRGNRIGVGACRRFDKIDHSLRQEATVRFVSTATHIRRHADAFPRRRYVSPPVSESYGYSTARYRCAKA
jgi:hypothetical protein